MKCQLCIDGVPHLKQYCGKYTNKQRAKVIINPSTLNFSFSNMHRILRNYPIQSSHSVIGYTFADEGVWEMPKATLSYEALNIDTEGNVTEGAYRLKLEGNFKQHIEPIVKFIKATIPSNDRTYDPNTYEWFYHEKWHPLMDMAFKGSQFSVQYTITKEAFTELKRKQSEWAKQAGQSFQTKQYNTSEDIEKFAFLLNEAGFSQPNGTFTGIVEYLENIPKDIAISLYKKAIRFFHPDLHPDRATQASELNEVFSRLKESYYIK